MKITWVNHASYIMEYDGISMITDPWYEGTSFDNGWALLAPSVIKPEDFAKITHIWFSHEHPDHFSPPNLNKIPAEIRKNITVLFQATSDHKIAAYCTKIGFGKIIEMETNRYYALSDRFQCMCNAYHGGDSWLHVKTDTMSVLNLNDCVVRSTSDAAKIHALTGDADVLFTQFGYANKIGNIGETERRLKASREKLERIQIQTDVFKPKVIVPFASYIYFCHEENSYMNDGINRIGPVAEFIENHLKITPVVLYPGDVWEMPHPHDNASAIARYNLDYAKIDNGTIELIKTKRSFEFAELTEVAEAFKQKIFEQSWKNRFFTLYPPAHFWVDDLQKAFQFDLKNGLRPSSLDSKNCNISLSSESLYFAFKFLYGGDTLNINGRFQTSRLAHKKNVRNYFLLASFVNRNEKTLNKDSVKRVLEYTLPYRVWKRLVK